VKTALIVVGGGVVLFAFYRAFQARKAGTSVVAALRHPTVPPDIAEIMANPQRAKTRTGATAF
jgi:hypothetical protein